MGLNLDRDTLPRSHQICLALPLAVGAIPLDVADDAGLGVH